MENLNNIKLNNLYKDIFGIVLKIGIENLNINYGDNTISFRPKNLNTYDFEIVFWLNESRISFNIEDWYEILDSYLENKKEAEEVFEFIDTIFRNEVFIEEYSAGKSEKIYRKNLVYTIKISNKTQRVDNVKKIFFKFPWIKEKLVVVNEFKALY